jgi:DNA helicase-2/ATP-dependent DNA helicase PcrA
MTRAKRRLFLTWAVSRQVFGQRRLSEPSRFLAEIPRQNVRLSGLGEPPPATRAELAVASVAALFAPEDLRPGRRVRHPLFGVGTVLRSEGRDDGLKVTVSFPGLGPKRLLARYAGLVPA